MVDDVDGAAELGEAVHLSDLEGAWFLSGGFELDEGDVSAGEDDESVWHACVAWAGEFWCDSACLAYLAD